MIEASGSRVAASGGGAGAGVVEVTDVVKAYGDKEVLRGVSLSVAPGEIFGLLGPNGAGKSTLLESIVGLRRIDSGSISVLGHEPTSSRAFITSRVSVQPQSASLFETLSVVETLRLYASFHESPRPVAEVMEEIGLVEKASTWSRDLSGGQLRRLLLGVALIGDPEVVVLDEPSAGLDPKAKQGLLAVVRQLRDSGVTVLFSTHDMQEATQVCDRVAILVDGAVRALDSPAELVRLSGLMSTVSFVVDADADLSDLRAAVTVTSFEESLVADGKKIEIATDDPDSVMRAVTFRSRLRARSFSVERSTLENYFLDVVSTSSQEPASPGRTEGGRA